MVTYLGSLVQLCCGEGGTLCGGRAHSVWTMLGLPQLTACVLSQSTLLRLQVALQGKCLKQALGCMHFPGLSHSGSGSRVLHKGTGWACVLRPSQVPAAQVTRCFASVLSQVCSASYHLPSPSGSVSWVRRQSAISGLLCVSFGELISDCEPPGRCQPPMIPGRPG